jgi:D-alanine-D-alanine ligase-like ATP-grasp enzyme
VKERLFLSDSDATIDNFIPQKLSLTEFLNQSDYVFLGLHGGIGENGTLQSMLKKRGAHFNGSGPDAAKTCMDKAETGRLIELAKIPGVHIPQKVSLSTAHLANALSSDITDIWNSLKEKLKGDSLIVKPQDDGCSAGVLRLFEVEDFKHYISALLAGEIRLPAFTINGQTAPIEMPTSLPKNLLFEEFIESDRVTVEAGKLRWHYKSGWVEVTVAVLGKLGELLALSPSITVAGGNVLSLEEKFQGGTGVNITPPPTEFVSAKVTALVKKRIAAVANVLGIENYARLDTFIHVKTGELYFIEANTLPGLTPSTVLYHQALAEKKPLYPRELLEKIVELSW